MFPLTVFHPTWLYHRVDGARLVTAEAERFALGADGWLDTPAHFLNPAADCCAPAAESRGYRHAEECAFTPAPPSPDAASPDAAANDATPAAAPVTRAEQRAAAKAAKAETAKAEDAAKA